MTDPTTIRTAKRRARQTEIGITLGLLLLFFETVRKMPRLLQLAFGAGVLWLVLYFAAHWRIALGLTLGLIAAWFMRREVIRADWGTVSAWRAARDAAPQTHYEFRHGSYYEVETHDAIPF
jgi:hypothetical protein